MSLHVQIMKQRILSEVPELVEYHDKFSLTDSQEGLILLVVSNWGAAERIFLRSAPVVQAIRSASNSRVAVSRITVFCEEGDSLFTDIDFSGDSL